MLHNSRRNPEHVSMIWWRLWIWHIPLDRNMILSRGMLILLSRASGFKVQILLVQFFYLSSSFSCSVLSAPRQCVCGPGVIQGHGQFRRRTWAPHLGISSEISLFLVAVVGQTVCWLFSPERLWVETDFVLPSG